MFYVSTIIAAQLAGEVYFAEKARDDEGKEIVGLAVWFPPGRVMYDRYVPSRWLGMPCYSIDLGAARSSGTRRWES